jgi:ribose transport system ATP-binding protein
VTKKGNAVSSGPDVILLMSGIRKEFPGVVALDGVDLDVSRGEVHVLLGENGAGKSTLMKILSGAHATDAGRVWIDGVETEITGPRRARELGVGTIYQELTLIPELSAAENIYLGREPRRLSIVNHSRMLSDATRVLEELGADVPAAVPVRTLSLAQRQLIEIAKALSLEPRILIMDEPTSALTVTETRRLFSTIRRLTSRGVAIIYISHRLDEIFEIGDRVTVLRDGRNVSTHIVKNADRRELVRLMADRELDENISRGTSAPGEELLRVEGLGRRGVLSDVSFSVHAGEILGIAGLLGAGRTELARAVFGVDPADAGKVYVRGKQQHIRSPRDAVRLGIGFVTEDRKLQGLVLSRSVRDNIVLPVLGRLSRLGVVRSFDEQTLAQSKVGELRIRTPSIEHLTLNLSGGNQQKVVLAKWLACDVDILFLDEPTRGIDVAAKQEIYALINNLAAAGMGIVMISSELSEIVGLSDRVLVMRGGMIAGEFDRAEATQERLLACAVGAA